MPLVTPPLIEEEAQWPAAKLKRISEPEKLPFIINDKNNILKERDLNPILEESYSENDKKFKRELKDRRRSSLHELHDRFVDLKNRLKRSKSDYFHNETFKASRPSMSEEDFYYENHWSFLRGKRISQTIINEIRDRIICRSIFYDKEEVRILTKYIILNFIPKNMIFIEIYC